MAQQDASLPAPRGVEGSPPDGARHGAGPPSRLGVWTRLSAFGRRWPALFVYAHRAALYLLPVELLTGAALYFPRLHTGLIAWLPLIEAIHVWAGIAFCALLLLPVLLPLGHRLLATVDWVATFWFVSGLGVTGLALWTATASGSLLRSGAFGLHGVLTVAFVAWVLYHGLVRLETALRGGDPERRADRRDRANRRAMLASLGRAVLGSFVGTAVFGWLGGAFAAVGRGVAAPMGGDALATGGGGTGGSRPIPGFQIYTVTPGFPSYDPTTWHLEIGGMVDAPASLSLADLEKLPQVTETRDFHCVTGWVVPGVVWQGVRISDLLQQVKPQAGAGWITFDSFDGVYTDSLSLSQATAAGVLLAHRADGAPLAVQQGAPLRLVVPQMYGYKSVKWVGRLRLVASRELGYWENRGYGPDAYLGTVNGWPSPLGGLGSLIP